MKGGTYMAKEQVNLFGQSINQLDMAIQEMRRVAVNLVPSVLVEQGLIQALENFCRELHDSGKVRIHFEYFNLPERLSKEQELICYRMIQEGLNNALKHSRAKQIIVQLNQIDNQIQVTIEDDGIGFNPSEVTGGSSGLINLKNRADYLKGNMQIHSEKGKGTTIQIEFPK